MVPSTFNEHLMRFRCGGGETLNFEKLIENFEKRNFEF